MKCIPEHAYRVGSLVWMAWLWSMAEKRLGKGILSGQKWGSVGNVNTRESKSGCQPWGSALQSRKSLPAFLPWWQQRNRGPIVLGQSHAVGLSEKHVHWSASGLPQPGVQGRIKPSCPTTSASLLGPQSAVTDNSDNFLCSLVQIKSSPWGQAVPWPETGLPV